MEHGPPRQRPGRVLPIVVIQASEVLHDVTENAEPARKWLDSIARLIWSAQTKENEAKQLPPPKEIKRIKRKKAEMDDDIPF
jgi:hypothetical protein